MPMDVLRLQLFLIFFHVILKFMTHNIEFLIYFVVLENLWFFRILYNSVLAMDQIVIQTCPFIL